MARFDKSLPRLPRHLIRVGQARTLLDLWAPVTIVRGLRGYGKTTLVSAWLHDQPDDVRTVWVSARTASNLEQFPTLLLDAMGEAGFGDRPDRVGPLPAGQADGDSDTGPGARSTAALSHHALRLLARVAHESMDAAQRMVLVIDDADALRDEPFIQGLVQAVARRSSLHLIVCSRGYPRVETVAAGIAEAVVISARELCFTVPQVSELARSMHATLPGAQIQRLHDACGGWAAVVALVLSEIGEPTEALPLARAEEYLREVLLPRVADQATFNWIMLIALASRVSHRLIRDLAAGQDPDSIIRLIESTGLAQRRYDADEVELLFPPFIQDTLRKAVAQRHPELTREMHRRLSRWFAGRPSAAEATLCALRHAVLGRDWAQADSIWASHSIELELTCLPQLFPVFDAMPEGVIAIRPGMRIAREMAKAASLVPPDHDGGVVAQRSYTEVSRRLGAKGLDGLPLHDLLYVGTGQLIGLRSEGKFSEANRVANAVETSANALMSQGHYPGDSLQWFHLQRGITHTLCAQHAAAAHSFELSWQHRRPCTSKVAAQASGNLALIHALSGDTLLARSWFERHHSIESSGAWAESSINVGARIAGALLALDGLDAEGSRNQLNHLGSGTAPHDLWPFVAYVDAQFGLHFGDPVSTLAELDNALRAHYFELTQGSAAILLLTRARAELLLAAGEGQQVQRRFADPMFERTAPFAVPLARLHLLTGNPILARRITARHRWSQRTPNRDRIELLLIKALAAHRMEEPEVSGELMRQALALYRHTGMLLPFTTMSPADLDSLFCHAGERLDGHDLGKVRAHRSPFPDRIQIISLTPRERLLAECLATTASRQQIADRLHVSVNTVRKQLVTLYHKLNVSTRDEALTRLEQLGLTAPASTVPQQRPDPWRQPVRS